MRKLIATALALVGLASTPAFATTTIQLHDQGALGSFTQYGEALTIPGGSAFSDFFKFFLSAPSTISVTESNSVVGAGNLIVGGKVLLASCVANCTGETLPPTSGGTIDFASLVTLTSTTQGGGFGPDAVAGGFYFVEVTGSAPAGAPRTYNISGTETTSIATGVPEPGTWAMMMLGFGLVSLAGYRRRRPRLSIP